MTMKKNFIIAALMLFVSLTASAQYKPFNFGLKFGPNMQWAGSSTKTVKNDKVKAGFNLGFVAEFYFVENYAIETGINLDFLRNRYIYEEARMVPDRITGLNIDSITGEVNRTMRGTYVEIPVMLKMRTNEFGDWRFFGEIGASIGVRCKVSAKDIFTYDILDDEYTYPKDEKEAEFINVREQYNPVTVKYIIAGGAEYAINGDTRAFARLIFNGNILNAMSLKYKRNSFGDEPNNYKYERLENDRLDVHAYGIGIEFGIMF